MYPSSRSTSAMPRQTRLLRQFTVLLLFRVALRIRVSMSEMQSVRAIVLDSVAQASGLCPYELPACLPHPGDLALERQLAEHDAADPELAVHAAGPPGELAAPHDAGAELGLPVALGHLRLGRHLLLLRLGFGFGGWLGGSRGGGGGGLGGLLAGGLRSLGRAGGGLLLGLGLLV